MAERDSQRSVTASAADADDSQHSGSATGGSENEDDSQLTAASRVEEGTADGSAPSTLDSQQREEAGAAPGGAEPQEPTIASARSSLRRCVNNKWTLLIAGSLLACFAAIGATTVCNQDRWCNNANNPSATESSSSEATNAPTAKPTPIIPSRRPTSPSFAPTNNAATVAPTNNAATVAPTNAPTAKPTISPTWALPTKSPTNEPSSTPTGMPTRRPALSPTPMRPFNDLCKNAGVIRFVDVDSKRFSGTTVDATIDDVSHEQCSNSGIATTAPGVWYKVVIQDRYWDRFCNLILIISTCGAETNFETQVSLFSGDCGTLTCVAASDNCSVVTKEIYPKFDEYYVLVHGSNSKEFGDFGLKVQYTCSG